MNQDVKRIADSLEKIEKKLDITIKNVEREKYGDLNQFKDVKPFGWFNSIIATIAIFILGIVVGYMLFLLGTDLLKWLAI